MSRMAGKVALITGAGAGMGRVHAVRLAQEGAHIIETALEPGGGLRDIANASLFLASNEARNITGVALPVAADKA